MFWIIPFRNKRMTVDSLACYAKACLLLRSNGTIKRLIVKDEQEIDNAKVSFYKNSQ